jgi:hypothetical protein
MDLNQSMNPTNRFGGDNTERKYSYIQSMIYELSSTAAALDCEIETAVRRSRLEPELRMNLGDGFDHAAC